MSARLLGLVAGWKGYAAAFAAGAILAGASAWTVQGWRYGSQIAVDGLARSQTETNAVQRAAQGKNDAAETVSRLPDGGAADRLRDAWARD